MKNRKLRAPSPALIIATCALVFSMAGTGYAVNQINGKTIKKGTIAGKALKSNTLTGKQINEAKLAKVPSAKSADSSVTAGDAAKLAGADASAFAKSTTFVHVSQRMNAGDADKTLVTAGDISIKMQCVTSTGSDRMKIYATTGANGALLDSEQGDSLDPLDTTSTPDNSEITDEINAVTPGTNYDFGYDDTGFVQNAAGTHLINLLEGSATKTINRGGSTCFYSATFLVE